MKTIEMTKPVPGMKLYEDVSFYPGVYNFFNQEGIQICASGITIHGNGCVFIGGKEKCDSSDDSTKQEFSYGYGNMIDQGLGYYGHGIHMEQVHDVTIENLQVRGFVNGLYMEGCSNCTIQDNDFSYNYHNPDWGWEEHADVGGILLLHSHHNHLLRNKANQVWSALVMKHSDHNEVLNNDFSHTSNVGLRCWMASYNIIEDNDFSWGIRKEANEVHARDSSCVLIESASNHNEFRRNDMRYGGDGLFIRSLNNQMSMYNLFEENDTSFANNNAIEAWDAHNTYIRNKANYSSYGFWLGCSDHTVLIGNEVLGNGISFQNAPESFGNAGIAVVNGSGNDFYVKDNVIMDNNGPGIAIRYTQETPSRNWIIEHNKIVNNHNDPRGYSGYGVYMKNALNIHFMNNEINNEAMDIYCDDHVSMVEHHTDDCVVDHVEVKQKPTLACVDEVVSFEVMNFSEAACYFDDGFMANTLAVHRSFEQPGRYRMFINASDQQRFGLYEQSIYVKAKGRALQELEEVSSWRTKEKKVSIKPVTHDGMEGISLCASHHQKSEFTCQLPVFSLQEVDALSFLYRYQCDFIDWNQEVKLCVILQDETGGYLKITSKEALFAHRCQKHNEAKYEWEHLRLPLHLDDAFDREFSDGFTGSVHAITFQFQQPQAAFVQFDISSAVLEEEKPSSFTSVLKGDFHQNKGISELVTFSSTSEDCYEIFKEHQFHYDLSKRWISQQTSDEESIAICLAAALPVDGVDLAFYADHITTLLPDSIQIYCDDRLIATNCPQANHVRLTFSRCIGKSYVIKFQKQTKASISLYGCQLLLAHTNAELTMLTESKESISLEEAIVKVNVETWPKTAVCDPLQVSLYEMKGEDITKAVCIMSQSIAFEDVRPGKETSIPCQDVTIEKGKQYALMLKKEPLAKGVQEGSYYRWVGNGIAPINGTYGYWNHDGVVNHTVTGWGECYLKLLYQSDIYDHATKNEGLGNRFGLPKMEALYQTFCVPAMQEVILQPDYLRLQGWKIQHQDQVQIKFTKPKQRLKFYFKEMEEVVIHFEQKQWRTTNGIVELESYMDGIKTMTFETKGNELMYIEEIGENI